MTTVVYPSLDGLLKAATPVEAEPFDVEALLMYRATKGQATNAGHQLTVYLNSLRVDTENARATAVALENENAELRDNIAHIEGQSGRCLACGEDWICPGWSAQLAEITDYDRLEALREQVAEALRWLDMAATYATSENVAAAIDDARAALRGGAE